MSDVTTTVFQPDTGIRRITTGRLRGQDIEVVFKKDALHYLLLAIDGPTARYLIAKAVTVERVAKRLCPVDTGRLRASISYRLGIDMDGVYAVIGTDVHYAKYVEFGTRFMRAQPFLRPALEYIK